MEEELMLLDQFTGAVDPDLDEFLLMDVEEQEVLPEPEEVSSEELQVKLGAKKLEEFQNSLQAMLDEAISARIPQESWMQTIYSIARGDVSITPVPDDPLQADTSPEEKPYIPLALPRLDALTANVSTIVGKQSPFMVAVDGPEGKEIAETLLHRIMRNAGFQSLIRKLAGQCGLVNFAAAYVSPKIEDDYVAPLSYGQPVENPSSMPGIEFGMVAPFDFVTFGAESSGIENALLVGHRFQMSRAQAWKNAKDGYFHTPVESETRNVSFVQLDDESYAGTILDQTAPSLAKEDINEEACTFWCVYVRTDLDGEEQWFKAIVGDSSKTVYRIERHPYRRHPYFTFRYLESPLGATWPVTSIGRQLFPIEDLYNQMFDILVQGSANAAQPPAVGLPSADKAERYERGQVMENLQGMANISFDGQYVLQSLPLLERTADQIARVSQNTIGTSNAGARTATENSIIAQGVQTSLEDLISVFTEQMPGMASYIMDQIVFGHYDTFQREYGLDAVPPKESLTGGIVWDVNGKSANSTPQARVQEAQMLLPVVMQTGGNPVPLIRGMIAQSPWRSLVDQIYPPELAMGSGLGELGLQGGQPVPPEQGLGPNAVPLEGVEGGMPSASPARGPFIPGDEARQVTGPM